jgi:zinc protease
MAAPGPLSLPVESFELDNGMTVLLSRDDRLPVVAVEMRFLVGSANESSGRTGFAHLFEHLMFQGTAAYDDEYFGPFEAVGGRVNGTTDQDRTNYFEVVPRNHLELSLWMQSDRLAGFLPVLTQEKLDNQRNVVKNERRANYENRPYGMARVRLAEALYPEGHPYHHVTIGYHEDLTAASLEDVEAFYSRYYVPANAVLTIAGDFDPDETRAMVEKYFGDLPGGERAARPGTAVLSGKPSAHLVEEDEVKLPRIYLAWRTPSLMAPGDAEMDILSSVLSDGKTSRLFKSLVYDQRVARNVYSYQASNLLSSSLQIVATAAPGVSVERLHEATREALAKALATPPTEDEMARAINGWRKLFFRQLESNISRAMMLSSYYHTTGNADSVNADLARYTSLDAAAVHAAAKKYIDPERMVRLDIVPKTETEGGAG